MGGRRVGSVAQAKAVYANGALGPINLQLFNGLGRGGRWQYGQGRVVVVVEGGGGSEEVERTVQQPASGFPFNTVNTTSMELHKNPTVTHA